MFLTRSEYDRYVRQGKMGLEFWVGRPGAQPRPGFCRVMGRPRNPCLAQRGDLLPSPLRFPKLDLCQSATFVLPLSHCWVLTWCGSENLRFMLGEEGWGAVLRPLTRRRPGFTPFPVRLFVPPFLKKCKRAAWKKKQLESIYWI